MCAWDKTRIKKHFPFQLGFVPHSTNAILIMLPVKSFSFPTQFVSIFLGGGQGGGKCRFKGFPIHVADKSHFALAHRSPVFPPLPSGPASLHSDWVKAWQDVILELEAFVREWHPYGLIWGKN